MNPVVAHGPEPFVLSAAAVAAYDAACGGAAPHGAPLALPPTMALVVGTIPRAVGPLVERLMAQHPAERRAYLMHRDERVVWHKTLPVGEPLFATAQLLSRETRRVGEFLSIGAQVHDAAGTLVAETRSMLFVREPSVAVPQGPGMRPAASGAVAWHDLPSWHVGVDAPQIYAAASFETNPIHLDDAVARGVGLPGRILHGLCTLAYAARSLATWAGPSLRMSGLEARFVRPVYPGDTVTCRLQPPIDDAPCRGPIAYQVCSQDGHEVIGRGQVTFVPRGQGESDLNAQKL